MRVALCVGIAIGRVGCFLAGLDDRTFGSPSALPWAIDFGDGVARHPVQQYESGFALLLALFLHRMESRPHRSGAVFRAFLAAYLFAALIGADLAAAAFLGMLAGAGIEFPIVALFAIGLVQLLWAAPGAVWAYKPGRKGIGHGIVIAAALVLLVNGGCFAIVSLSLGNMH
ncbi:MAG: prolipoprotein diacylglyceryl transferase family protein [Planctomycetota bacterium]